MIATIAEGHVNLADWLFLIGAILAFLAAIAYAPKIVTPKLTVWAGTLVSLALCSVSVGWLVL